MSSQVQVCIRVVSIHHIFLFEYFNSEQLE